MAEGASGLPRLKRCLIRRAGQQEQHGVAASTLQELKFKACNLLAIDAASQPVTLVLEKDGTIVEDGDYFLCLPPNTKFRVVAKNEKWTPESETGEGTTWPEEETANTNEVDGGGEQWQALARQLKDDLSTIVLMSEEDLQALVDVPCSDLARELSEDLVQTQRLQGTFQETLDRREEARQSRQLLELYLQAVKREDQAAEASEAEGKSEGGADAVDAGSNGTSSAQTARLSTRVVSVLKEKPAPELSLSSQDLELVSNEDSGILSRVLSWDKRQTEALKEACVQELSRRRQQCHCLKSLRTISRGKKKQPEAGEGSSSKRRK